MVAHQYEIDRDDGHTVVFVCPVETCRRRIVVRSGEPRPVVIDTGDFFASHVGAIGPVSITLGHRPGG